ncbi:MCP four helix bundle domain-containing protein [Nostoc ellipsosporum NOK]|jgi:hypothetical protein|nr:MCP four helix bundle domain-containing protein [Nostoc ellipsosporum NOK]
MKAGLQTLQKRRLLLGLFIIFVIMLLNNFSSRKSYLDLKENMTSIYHDRLMPATFLFRLNDLLYQKQLFHLSQETSVSEEVNNWNRQMDSIIDAYEKTYLTDTEKRYWKNFRDNLDAYNAMEKSVKAPYTQQEFLSPLNGALAALRDLNEVQTTEGNLLQRESETIVRQSVIKFYLEISLLLVLCIMALVLVHYSGRNMPFDYSRN